MSAGSLRSQLNLALQNVIPGLQTMDAPPEVDGANASEQDMVVIDMPDPDGRFHLPGGGGRGGGAGRSGGGGGGGGGGLPMGETDQEGEREGGRQGGRGGLTDTNLAHYLSEGCAELLLFGLIVALKLGYDHRLGLTVFLGLIGTFLHHSGSVKREIDLKEKRSVPSLLLRLGLLVVNIAFIYYVLEEQQLYKCLIFLNPNIEEMTLWAVLWCVGISDFVIKYSTLCLKCLVTLLPASVLSFKKRGKVYLAIEELSQIYRMLPPFPLWLAYFLDDRDSHWIVSYVLTFAYVILKAFTIYRKQSEVRKAVRNIFSEVQYGTTPSQDQMRRVGEACPICQDTFQEPIQLACKHIFCEDCVALWFDRERTCPMCRAQIASAPTWRDGSTAMSIQLF
ncbi:E3 ubiquitin-protein ligase RNFT2-like [Diadema setosum]|uniref:E3 ubiquitin-protein ligase RNFT2-like n=1 Tax=Diadema setosum TaxID=31175 RepID=UPI003B3AB55B